MKVSDEIRNWCEFEDGTECGGFVTKASFDKLYDLADRIDAEMVELPKDAKGVPIHAGDTVWAVWDVEDGMELVVNSVTLYAGGVTKVDAVCDGCHAHVSPDSFSHTRPDSFERIADELEEWSEDNMVNGSGEVFDRAAEFAHRIRKLAKKEGEQCQ